MGWEKPEAVGISLCSNSCVYLVTFSSMTSVSWVPPLGLPNQPMCLWGSMQHTGSVTATTVCCCGGITEDNGKPKMFLFWLFKCSEQAEAAIRSLKISVLIPGSVCSFYTSAHAAKAPITPATQLRQSVDIFEPGHSKTFQTKSVVWKGQLTSYDILHRI